MKWFDWLGLAGGGLLLAFAFQGGWNRDVFDALLAGLVIATSLRK